MVGGKRVVFSLMLVLISLFLVGSSSDEKLDRWASKYGYLESEVIAIEVADFGFPYLQGKANNQELTFLFDTGNMVGLLLAPEVADRLDLEETNTWQSYDSSGQLVGGYRVFDEVNLKLFGTSTPIRAFESPTEQFEAIIGPGMLTDQRFTLDYRRGLMGVSPTSMGKVAEDAVVLPLIQNSRYPGMPVVEGSVNNQRVLIQLDTGKSRTCVDQILVQELNLPKTERGYQIDQIELGSITVGVPHARMVSFAGISRGYPGPILLGLGSDILSQFVVTVDYLAGKVIISRY